MNTENLKIFVPPPAKDLEKYYNPYYFQVDDNAVLDIDKSKQKIALKTFLKRTYNTKKKGVEHETNSNNYYIDNQFI